MIFPIRKVNLQQKKFTTSIIIVDTAPIEIVDSFFHKFWTKVLYASFSQITLVQCFSNQREIRRLSLQLSLIESNILFYFLISCKLMTNKKTTEKITINDNFDFIFYKGGHTRKWLYYVCMCEYSKKIQNTPLR